MKTEVSRELPDAAVQIRQKVFVEEQGFCDEIDETDGRAEHFVVYQEESLPVATCRVFWDNEMRGYVVGRFAVLPEYRRQSVGAFMMEEVEKHVRKKGGKSIILHAQCPVSGFYQKLGFVQYGDVEDVQGCPHIWMKKELLPKPAKLIILRGNSGSGKSSAARELQQKFGRGTLIIPQDTVRREMLYARDGADTKALPLLIDLLEYGKKTCEVTILEGILYSEWYRPLFQRALEEYGQENIYAYYYDLPFEETLRRHATKPIRSKFGEEAMRRWWNEKDFIGIIPEEILREDISLSDAVERIYQAVAGTEI